MSSIIQSAVAPSSPTGPDISAAVRNDDQNQSNSGSFGEALARSLLPAPEPAEKTVGKSALLPPGRRQADKPEPDAQDLVSALGLMLFPPESRAARTASTVAAAGQTSQTGPAIVGSETLAVPRSNPAVALSGLSSPLPRTTPDDAPALAGDSASAQQTSGNLRSKSVQEPGLATVSEKNARPNPLQVLPPTASDGLAPAVAGSSISTDIGVHVHDFSRESFKQDGKGPSMRNDSIEADTGLLPTATPGSLQEPGKMADPTGKGLNQFITSTDALHDGQMSSNPTLPLNLVSAAPQGTDSVAAPSANAASPVMTATLTPEVGTNAWGKLLAQQVVSMGKAGHQITELQLNPPGLGPLKVTLSMNDQQMQAMFVSAHPSVRAAVEAALPQLRSTLADSGISLGHTSVGADSQQQAAFSSGSDNPAPRGTYRPSQAVEPAPAAPTLAALDPIRRRNGISIDTYA